MFDLAAWVIAYSMTRSIVNCWGHKTVESLNGECSTSQ